MNDMRALALEYIKKGRDLLKEKRDQLKQNIDDFTEAPVTQKTLKRYFELQKEGFDLIKAIPELVQYDMALEEIEREIYFNSPEFKKIIHSPNSRR